LFQALPSQSNGKIPFRRSNIIKGIVFDIQRFCVDDGPGIRTTVFMKGCNMRCFWCHNPESLEAAPQVRLISAKCVSCGRCFTVCPAGAHRVEEGQRVFERSLCQRCGKCAAACPAEALLMAGKEMTAQEVFAVIGRDEPFYQNSGGGVTFSGGEPLLQLDFLLEMLRLCREKGYHTAVESALNVPWAVVEQAAPLVSLFLSDIKLMDSTRHKQATGCANDRILANLQKLSDSGSSILVRIPVIPVVNDTIEDMEQIARFVMGLTGCIGVQLMPFHNLAQAKYESLGLSYQCAGMANLPRESLSGLEQAFARQGIKVY
jgi:pyruvate formate lyase activating enzyme